MFDGMMGSKFSNKCKSKLKCIKVRIGPLRGKKQAMVRFQRKDVADLLAAGHQENALGRIDALSTDANLAQCYEIIEQCCDFIQSQMPVLQKERDCPEEVAEAISTLIYAAARFPDLPELCDLRHIFIDRYGSSIESNVNSEFMKKVQKKTLSKDEKLQIMREIADEFSIRWSFTEFGTTPNTVKKSVAADTVNEVRKPVSAPRREVRSLLKGEPDVAKQQMQVQNGIRLVADIEKGQSTDPQYTKARGRGNSDKNDTALGHGKDQLSSPPNSRPVGTPVPPYTKPNTLKTQYDNEEVRVVHNKGRAANMIPPYVKPHLDHVVAQGDLRLEAREFKRTEIGPLYDDGPSVNERPMSVRTAARKPALQNSVNADVSTRAVEAESRRGNLPRTREPEEGNAIYYGKLLSRISSEHGRRGRFRTRNGNGEYEDETVLDRLLVHYSKKGTSRGPGEDRRSEVVRADGSADDKKHRNSSVPREAVGEKEVRQVMKRATSLQPDVRGSQIRKGVPDFDQLAARIAALKDL